MPRFSIALAALAVLGWSTPAWAHAHPRQLSPKANAILKAPPSQVKLTFSEALQPGVTRVEVKDNGRLVSVGTGTVDPKTHKTLSVTLSKPGLGRYIVSWHALAVDGHATSGQYSFNVDPGDGK